MATLSVGAIKDTSIHLSYSVPVLTLERCHDAHTTAIKSKDTICTEEALRKQNISLLPFKEDFSINQPLKAFVWRPSHYKYRINMKGFIFLFYRLCMKGLFIIYLCNYCGFYVNFHAYVKFAYSSHCPQIKCHWKWYVDIFYIAWAYTWAFMMQFYTYFLSQNRQAFEPRVGFFFWRIFKVFFRVNIGYTCYYCVHCTPTWALRTNFVQEWMKWP